MWTPDLGFSEVDAAKAAGNIASDYGEYLLNTLGEIPIVISSTPEGSLLIPRNGSFFIGFSTGTYVGTIELTGFDEQQAQAAYKKMLTCGLEVQANPKHRYFAETQEWVVPFHVVTLPDRISELTDQDRQHLLEAENKRQRRAAKVQPNG